MEPSTTMTFGRALRISSPDDALKDRRLQARPSSGTAPEFVNAVEQNGLREFRREQKSSIIAYEGEPSGVDHALSEASKLRKADSRRSRKVPVYGM
jgi:hypothetical protein